MSLLKYSSRLPKSFSMPVKYYSTKQKLFMYQDQLPSLPVPELNQTLETYKKSIIPFYPSGENDPNFISYSKVIDDFASTQGPKLQEKLVEFSSDKRNWLAYWWDNYAYLDYRDPLSFVSYFFAHKDLNTHIGKDQLLKASCITYQTLKFMESIENESLSPELIKGSPFCMESFKWMFNNCRIPGEKSDTNSKFTPSENRFMIVISNDRFYKLYHHDSNDQILPLSTIYANLSSIHINSHKLGKPKNSIGILTSGDRDTWYKDYKELISNPINSMSLRDIHASSFILILDDAFPQTIHSKSTNVWFGTGSNRYSDKPVQIIVSKNGSSGFIGEHSKMDGTPNLRMNDLISKQLKTMNLSDFTPSDPVILYRELGFEISSTTQNAIIAAGKKFEQIVNSVSLNTWQYFGLGKNQIKKFKCSPDAFIQMVLQLAYFKYTGTVRPTYESASTRKYFGGRTETCRSVSKESLNFVRTFENPSCSKEQKIAAFRDAANSHVAYISKASDGYGVDRHLFGLSQLSDPTESKHELFTNPMFKYSSYWYLSTSQLSSEEFNGYGWAPVVPEGLGLAYMVNSDWLHVNVTCFKDNMFGLKGDELVYYLGCAASELKELLSEEVELKAKL
ncbi:hypothetical protein CANARDRAFT_29532 [[Candida] arabinofermentans NRRL YB-2248]|uniref:Carnitine O-acetyltransferase, mitochondrial n=1 Tax=[Candida] arabinofermentans NRRL YB-2248 TaxID=983967 RepID=A0A1E4SX72_9ASCO|nr:hypothetical protein CANARDRAFT_29532 [[Candida] arabinofermentans NRRL YB-2248]